MATRFPGEPFSPDRMPDPAADAGETDPIFATIYRSAVTGADAYRATRTAVRRTEETLRLGNRFVRFDRYREIAFVALGGAALSQTFAVHEALGEALTQGFVLGPDPLPREVPFRSRQVPTGLPGDGTPGAEVLELAGGLGEKDLLLVLLSAGALGYLATAPDGVAVDEWVGWLQRLSRAGATSGELGRLARVTGAGAIGGRLAAATRADVVPLVVDRGDGADLVGGGPTWPVSRAERVAARAVLGRLPGLEPPAPALRRALDPGADPPDGRPAGGVRPVAVTAPADALREIGEAVAEKRWRPVLAELHLEAAPEAAADQLVARSEALGQSAAAEPKDPKQPSRGVIAFAATTLGVLEGVDDRPAMARFLHRVADRLPRRDATVGVLRTVGAPDGSDAPGGVVGASRGPQGPATPPIRPLRMHAGITDVGEIAAVVLPAT